MVGLRSEGYRSPEITDLGTLKHLTQHSPDGGLHFHQAALGSLDSDQVPTTSTNHTPTHQVSDNTTSGGGTPGGGNEVNGSNTSGGSTPGNGADTPAAGVGSGGGGGVGPDELPFTGLEVGPVALIGASLATAGAALRRIARRP